MERGPRAEVVRGPGGPAHRARHQRDEPVPAARPARPVLGPVRPAAAAGRHRVRPVRAAAGSTRSSTRSTPARGSWSPARRPGSPSLRRAARTSRRSPRRSAWSCRASRSSSRPTRRRWTGCSATPCGDRGRERRPARDRRHRGRLVLLPAHHPAHRPGPVRAAREPGSATRCCAARCWPAPTGWSTPARPRPGARRRSTWPARGAVLPEVLAAAAELADEGIAAHVVDVTSADRLYRAWQRTLRQGVRTATPPSIPGALRTVFGTRAPVVTVHDAASHALGWLGSALGVPAVSSASTRSASPGPSATSTSCTTSTPARSSTPRWPRCHWTIVKRWPCPPGNHPSSLARPAPGLARQPRGPPSSPARPARLARPPGPPPRRPRPARPAGDGRTGAGAIR